MILCQSWTLSFMATNMQHDLRFPRATSIRHNSPHDHVQSAQIDLQVAVQQMEVDRVPDPRVVAREMQIIVIP